MCVFITEGKETEIVSGLDRSLSYSLEGTDKECTIVIIAVAQGGERTSEELKFVLEVFFDYLLEATPFEAIVSNIESQKVTLTFNTTTSGILEPVIPDYYEYTVISKSIGCSALSNKLGIVLPTEAINNSFTIDVDGLSELTYFCGIKD